MNARDAYLEANRAALAVHLDRIAARLADRSREPGAHAPLPMPLERLCRRLELSPFECDVVLLAAGMEVDGRFGPLCAKLNDNDDPTLTFALALCALEGAHWSAITPHGALRRWCLVALEGGASPTTAPLRIDERILHHLVGLERPDVRIADLATPLDCEAALTRGESEFADGIAAALTGDDPPVIVQITGRVKSRALAVASAVAVRLGRFALEIHADALAAGDLEIRLLARESLLSDALLVLDAHDGCDAGALGRFARKLEVPCLVLSRTRVERPGRDDLAFDLPTATYAERLVLWHDAVGTSDADDRALQRLACNYDVDPAILRRAQQRAATSGESLPEILWRESRLRTRAALDELATRIEPRTTFEDLVLAPAQLQTLRDIVAHVRHRAKVFEEWGMGRGTARGQGTAVLFAGPSGVGKSACAEAITLALSEPSEAGGGYPVDLYRVDLTIISKYVGDTEKALTLLFDRAEACGAVLLFDEADALFHKRAAEVRDSHDHYANLTVSTLLTLLDSYTNGLAILTSNMRSALDTAFLRRLRFVVDFYVPGPAERREIWARAFPRSAPTSGLDLERLATLEISGGNIRNVALRAAFRAADAGEPIGMRHLAASVRAELAHLERTPDESELRSWT